MKEPKLPATRQGMLEILRRRKGTMARVSRELGVSHVTISHWLRGRINSARVEEALTRAAREILAQPPA